MSGGEGHLRPGSLDQIAQKCVDKPSWRQTTSFPGYSLYFEKVKLFTKFYTARESNDRQTFDWMQIG